MQYLVLVKHSLPMIAPDQPARTWRLSKEGQERCVALAARLAEYMPARLYTSSEPKAIETAALVGEQYRLGHQIIDGLEEHHRATAGYLQQGAFQQAVADFFAEPERLVFGEETAGEATRRFGAAIDALIAAAPHENLIIFTHGTVLSLFAAQRASVEPFSLWQQLGLPSFAVFELPSMQLTRVVANIY